MHQFSKIKYKLFLLVLATGLFACDPEFTSTPTVSGVPVCTGGTIKVSFKANNPSYFEAELSNASGNFSSPTLLGPVNPGSTSVTVPQVPAGAGYRIRIKYGNYYSNPSAAFRIRACGGDTPPSSLF